MLVISKQTEAILYLLAGTSYPEECCGILLGRRDGEVRFTRRVLPVVNRCADGQRGTQFVIDPLDIRRAEALAEEAQLEIIGFYHSHPGYAAVASEADVRYMMEGYSYPIVSLHSGTAPRLASFERKAQAGSGVEEETVTIQQ